MDIDKYFEELNDMANFKNFGEKVETEEKPLKQCQECICKSCEQVAWLEQENAELKAENERLKEEIEIRDNLSELFRKEALSWANIANEYQKDKTKLKQTLQEIKKIIEKGQWDFAGVTEKQILQKITKAEEE